MLKGHQPFFFFYVFTLSHPHAKQLPWLSSSNGNLLSSSLFRGRECLSAVYWIPSKPPLSKTLLFYKDWSDVPAWINLSSFIFVSQCAHIRYFVNAYLIKYIKSLTEFPYMSLKWLEIPFPFWPSSRLPKVPHTWSASLGETNVHCLGVTVSNIHLWFT